MTPKQQVELKSGEVYRGTLVEAEDNWNCQLTNVSLTGRDGALFLQKIDVVVVALYVGERNDDDNRRG